MKLKFFLLTVITISLSLPSQAQSRKESKVELQQEMRQCPQKAGSSYYAYPGPLQKEYTPAPDGYVPVYLSHYGRHGSRFLTEDSRYQEVLDVFDTHELTDYGKEIRDRLEIVWQDAKGCGGDLTPVGERQHYDIAQRMAHQYPVLFQGNAHIKVVSSTSRRCMMSMMAFCEGLKEMYPALSIARTAHEKDMAYINYESPELKSFSSKSGVWWKGTLTPFIRKCVKTDRLIKTLFKSDIEEDTAYNLFDGLYWIASDMQNVELGDLSFYDLFTSDELYAYWTCQNLKMYTLNGPSSVNGGITAKSSRFLLSKIIEEADDALQSGKVTANLRFGHDSALIRLLTLMKAGGCSDTAENDEVCTVWQDFRITPMAANLQMVFYKNEAGEVIVKFLLNENEIFLPVPGEAGPYYTWNKVKEFWIK